MYFAKFQNVFHFLISTGSVGKPTQSLLKNPGNSFYSATFEPLEKTPTSDSGSVSLSPGSSLSDFCEIWFLRLETSRFYGIQSDELALQSALLGALASSAFRSSRRRWRIGWVKFINPLPRKVMFWMKRSLVTGSGSGTVFFNMFFLGP